MRDYNLLSVILGVGAEPIYTALVIMADKGRA
jgi:hypothetical protein